VKLRYLFFILFCFSFLYGFEIESIKSFFSEDNLIHLLEKYGYIILFVWSIFEGETGLVMAGILSYTGSMNLGLSILVGALGGFTGDQIYFYLGKINKKWILEEFKTHKRKFARARLLIKKFGAWVIFLQRFIYGMRTIIPMTIGLSGYDVRKFAIINFFSAIVWAGVTIIPSYFFGDKLLEVLKWLKHHWYIGITGFIILILIFSYINKKEDK